MKNIPYTYLIGWSELDRWYYGVRYGSTCNPNDLWISYFTSSDTVKEYRKRYGPPDVKEIRKTFITPEQALLWETKVLKKLDVRNNDRWLNLQDNGGGINLPPDHSNKVWINDGIKNRRIIKEDFEKYPNWKIGRLLGEVKFYLYGNRKRDKITGRFIPKQLMENIA